MLSTFQSFVRWTLALKSHYLSRLKFTILFQTIIMTLYDHHLMKRWLADNISLCRQESTLFLSLFIMLRLIGWLILRNCPLKRKFASKLIFLYFSNPFFTPYVKFKRKMFLPLELQMYYCELNNETLHYWPKIFYILLDCEHILAWMVLVEA